MEFRLKSAFGNRPISAEMGNKQKLLLIFFFASLVLVLDFVQRQAPASNALDLLPASRFLKLAEEPTVYYVNQYRQKIPIPSAKVFLSYGAEWQDVETIEKAELDFYKNAEYIKLIGNARVYFLKDGVKRYLTQKAASALKILPEEVVAVNRTEFNAYASGETMEEEEASGLQTQKNTALLSEVEAQKCVPDESVGGEDGCKIFEALEKNDVSLCGQISSPEWKGKCYSSFIPDGADSLVNCSKLENGPEKNNCIQSMAIAKSDSALCSQIMDTEKAKVCESYVGVSSRQIGSCDRLAGDNGNACNFIFGTLNQDTASCEKISNPEMKNSCRESINQTLSINGVAGNKTFLTALAGAGRWLLPAKAQAQFGSILSRVVGGKFLAGLTFDIFTITITPPCMMVSVIGPRPGIFSWRGPRIYDNFFKTAWHSQTNMLGLASNVPTICPPTLNMFGSSLTP